MQCLDDNEFEVKPKIFNDSNTSTTMNSPFEPILILKDLLDNGKLQNDDNSLETSLQKTNIKRRNSNYLIDDCMAEIPLKRMRAKSLPIRDQEREVASIGKTLQESKESITVQPMETNDESSRVDQQEKTRSITEQYPNLSQENTDEINHFFESLKPYVNAMNFRQRLVFKEKIFRALIETFEDNTDFPSSSAGTGATATSSNSMTEERIEEYNSIQNTSTTGQTNSVLKDKTSAESQRTKNVNVVKITKQLVTQKHIPVLQSQSQRTIMPNDKFNNHHMARCLDKNVSDWSQPGETISMSNTNHNTATTTSRTATLSSAACKIPKQATRPKTFVVVTKAANLNGNGN